MSKYISFFILLAASVLTLSCAQKKENDIVRMSDISWIIGQWQTEPRERVEVWNLKGDRYTASGLLLTEENPRVNELMNIGLSNGHLQYSVLAYGQNDNEYVDFPISNADPKDLIFANPDHDFPKIIRYTLVEDNMLRVQVGDNENTVEFNFYRTK